MSDIEGLRKKALAGLARLRPVERKLGVVARDGSVKYLIGGKESKPNSRQRKGSAPV
jgi:hypothetical protein